MMAMRLRDKDVCLQSTIHNTAKNGGKDIHRPQAVIVYNFLMGGIDRTDEAMLGWDMG